MHCLDGIGKVLKDEMKCVMKAAYRLSAKEGIARLEAQADWLEKQYPSAAASLRARGETNTLPLHVEVLYNEYNFTAAFACASLLAGLALVTLVIKTIVEIKSKETP